MVYQSQERASYRGARGGNRYSPYSAAGGHSRLRDHDNYRNSSEVGYTADNNSGHPSRNHARIFAAQRYYDRDADPDSHADNQSRNSFSRNASMSRKGSCAGDVDDIGYGDHSSYNGYADYSDDGYYGSS
ncbi:hypothetical protein J3B02_006479, partial [Coemansia erecta]